MTTKRKIISIILVLATAFALAGNAAYAQAADSGGSGGDAGTKLTIPKPKTLPGLTSKEQEKMTGKKHVGTQLIPRIANMFIGFAGILCFIFLLIGGIRYLTAYGNEEALGTAKKTIVFAIVGLLISIFAYAMVALIAGLQFESKNKPSAAHIPGAKTAYAKYEEEPKIKGINLLPSPDGNEKNENIEKLPFAKAPKDKTDKEIMAHMVKSIYGTIAKLAIGIASILIVIGFVVAGALYVTAQGSEDQMTKAKNILIYTLIAVAVIASAYGITLGVMKFKDQVWKSESSISQTA